MANEKIGEEKHSREENKSGISTSRSFRLLVIEGRGNFDREISRVSCNSLDPDARERKLGTREYREPDNWLSFIGSDSY